MSPHNFCHRGHWSRLYNGRTPIFLLGVMDIFNQSVNRFWCLFICFLTVCCGTCQSEGILNQILKPTICEICANQSCASFQFWPDVGHGWPLALSGGSPFIEKRQKIAPATRNSISH